MCTYILHIYDIYVHIYHIHKYFAGSLTTIRSPTLLYVHMYVCMYVCINTIADLPLCAHVCVCVCMYKYDRRPSFMCTHMHIMLCRQLIYIYIYIYIYIHIYHIHKYFAGSLAIISSSTFLLEFSPNWHNYSSCKHLCIYIYLYIYIYTYIHIY